ncbi:DNA-3-methyladenine glycosylase family protein [Actinomadura macrotermitis]|uniref:DNA-3-methyladenine glycosylase II n=1 Tax=Actinomadura macrotermitis TaxID=2585200 RepID=A0A7K0C6K7_9ACTN|nr:DNA-3-methyladenine glycosylase 2 [Actinomadura macrotermitis]MQY09099.1 DNA-3-methyladenine glycosylase [Actinomadura macrotermitis]
MNTESVLMPATAPFDFGHTLAFMSGFWATANSQRVVGDGLVTAVRAAGRTVAAVLTAEGGGLRCVLHAAGPLTPDVVRAATGRIASSLGLDDDLSGFYDLARDDPDFAPVAERLRGYHQVRFPSPLETAVWAILAQRTALKVAAKEKDALATPFGNTLTLDGADYTAFPDVEQLASLQPGRIAELIGNRRKGEYVSGTVRAWLDIDEGFLRTGPYAEAKDVLLGLPGIGAWSAAFIMLRGLGRTDETPDEKQLKEAASRVYGRPLSGEQVQRLGAAYGPWQGYWAHYLRATA